MLTLFYYLTGKLDNPLVQEGMGAGLLLLLVIASSSPNPALLGVPLHEASWYGQWRKKSTDVLQESK